MIQHECGECAGWRGMGGLNPSREAKFSGANGDREILFFFLCLDDHQQHCQFIHESADYSTHTVHTLFGNVVLI